MSNDSQAHHYFTAPLSYDEVLQTSLKSQFYSFLARNHKTYREVYIFFLHYYEVPACSQYAIQVFECVVAVFQILFDLYF